MASISFLGRLQKLAIGIPGVWVYFGLNLIPEFGPEAVSLLPRVCTASLLS